MGRCPKCRSIRVVVVLEPHPRAFCASCGARWTPRGHRERSRPSSGRPYPEISSRA
jgi:hypothetical protein